MPIKYIDWITRDMLRAAPDSRFVFGDNVARQGLGGQAKAMRGEPNAIGIATKWRPDRDAGAFFSDANSACATIIGADLGAVDHALNQGRIICVPSAGLGNGLSELPKRAPLLYAMLISYFATNSTPPGLCPWPNYAEFDDVDMSRWPYVKSVGAGRATRQLMRDHGLHFMFDPGGGEFVDQHSFRCRITTNDDVLDLARLRLALAAKK